MALSHRAEWAMRLPFCLLGVLGIYGIYLCVSRFVSRRAGLFAALVTATSPLYSLVARQAMTDMAFVGPMTMALALGALALFDDEDTPLPRREARLGKLKLSWPDHPLLYLAAGFFAAGRAAAADRQHASSCAGPSTSGRGWSRCRGCW